MDIVKIMSNKFGNGKILISPINQRNRELKWTTELNMIQWAR